MRRRRPPSHTSTIIACCSCVLVFAMLAVEVVLLLRNRQSPSNSDGAWRAVPGPDAAVGPAGEGFWGLPVPEQFGHVPGYAPWVPQLGRDYRAGYNVTAELEKASLPEYQPPVGRPPALTYPPLHSALWTTVSVRPRILVFPRIITDEEADLIKREASSKLARSEVRPTGGGHRGGKSQVRTSRGAFLRTDTPLWMRRVRDRLLNITGIPLAERLQVLRYEHGEHYFAHNDYFDPERYGTQKNNRAATFFLFLGTMDQEDGGMTSWPRAGGGPPSTSGKWRNDDACHTGLQFWPRKGAAVLFYSMRPDGHLDPYAVHAGCDVLNGTKWTAPLWFRVPKPLYREPGDPPVGAAA